MSNHGVGLGRFAASRQIQSLLKIQSSFSGKLNIFQNMMRSLEGGDLPTIVVSHDCFASASNFPVQASLHLTAMPVPSAGLRDSYRAD